MTLHELSTQYRDGASLLQGRVHELKTQAAQAGSELQLRELNDRIRILTAMWRDMREVAALTEHYYERGYCRNANYIL